MPCSQSAPGSRTGNRNGKSRDPDRREVIALDTRAFDKAKVFARIDRHLGKRTVRNLPRGRGGE
jgi:hypothetical protein